VKAAVKLALPIGALAILLVILMVPFESCQRTVLAPDLSAFDPTVYFTGQISYVPVTQESHASLAYTLLGLGASPYNSSYSCSDAQFYCTYAPGSPYPDVFLAGTGYPSDPHVGISHIHVTLNGSEFKSVVVSFVLENDLSVPASVNVEINSSLAPTSPHGVQPGNSSQCSFTIYPSTIPEPGDHLFLKVMVLSGYFWFKYVQIEG